MLRMLAIAGVALCAVAAQAQDTKPLATTDGDIPGVTLDVHRLAARNGTVLLTFTIKNDSNKAIDPDTLSDRSIEKYDAHSISGIYLIDNANKKKYLVMYDTANQCMCSRGTDDIGAKTAVNLWAKFPAPPDSVTSVGIEVPHFLPIDDVPISR